MGKVEEMVERSVERGIGGEWDKMDVVRVVFGVRERGKDLVVVEDGGVGRRRVNV